ncbi:MAG: hypothetical protein ACFFG0_04010 [Candidatus Thorarchaeota archaeon]
MTELPDVIIELSKKYKVSVERSRFCDRNEGASAGQDIFLGEFDDPDIEIVAFFHELGHCISRESSKRRYTMCILSGEGHAWEVGLDVAFQNGYKWDYYSKEMKWARGRLATYVKNTHNF